VSGAAPSPEGTAQAVSYIQQLSRQTGWTPPICLTVASGEPNTKYGFFTRALMRSIAPSHGRTVDVRSDYEFTDWEKVDQFARQFARQATPRRRLA
jgi:menaquinone-dependent protoporphyrinogen oxidase